MKGPLTARAGGRVASPGFTLLEILVVLVVIAVLAALAYPSYVEHVVRGRIALATAALNDQRAEMEQYFLSKRTYAGAACPTGQAPLDFTLSCVLDTDSYTLVATGRGLSDGFVYTLDQHGQPRTTALPTRWGTLPTGGYGCWVARQGEVC